MVSQECGGSQSRHGGKLHCTWATFENRHVLPVGIRSDRQSPGHLQLLTRSFTPFMCL